MNNTSNKFLTFLEKRRRHFMPLSLVVLLLLSACLLLFGNRGYFDLRRIERRHAELTQEIERLRQEKIEWELRLQSLRQGKEEYEAIARKEMGFIGKQEILYEVRRP